MARRICILACLLIVVFVAAATADEVATHTSLTCDLDSDGVAEVIEYQMTAIHTNSPSYYDDFTITIDGVSSSHLGHALTGNFRTVDIDTTDHFVELAVSEAGPSGDDKTHFFRYSNGKLDDLGSLPGRAQSEWRPLVVDGSGVVVAHCRGKILHTWYYACKYRVGSSGIFEQIPETTYPMGAQLTLKQEFGLVSELGSSDIVIELHPGDMITLLSSDNERWCHAETEDHRQGWFEVTQFNRLSDGRVAYVVFDGLCLAD